MKLVPFEAQHVECFYRWWNDYDLYRENMDVLPPKTMQQVQQILGDILGNGTRMLWVITIIEPPVERAIGYCQLAEIDVFHKRCSAHCTIGDAEARKSVGAYGLRAYVAICDYAFKHLHMNRVGVLKIADGPKDEMCNRAGLAQEARYEDFFWRDGVPVAGTVHVVRQKDMDGLRRYLRGSDPF
jgi:hypothetical protein